MSNNNMDLEDKNKVVITPEDSKECEKFFDFFEIPTQPELRAAFAAFQKNPTLQNQEELKFWLANEISISEHPVFKDEVFAQVRPETKEVWDELRFARELEKHISSDSNE